MKKIIFFITFSICFLKNSYAREGIGGNGRVIESESFNGSRSGGISRFLEGPGPGWGLISDGAEDLSELTIPSPRNSRNSIIFEPNRIREIDFRMNEFSRSFGEDL